VAGGSYWDPKAFDEPAFVWRERDGFWGKTHTIPGAAAGYPGTPVLSISCVGASSCAATGVGFVVDETNGVWGRPAGTSADPVYDTMSSVSCGSPGNCVLGSSSTGSFEDGARRAPGEQAAFLMSSKNGVWGKPKAVRGIAAAYVASVSCAGAGNCAATGSDGYGVGSRAFVVAEENGIWGKAHYVRGSRSDRRPHSGDMISCVKTGRCVIAGDFVTAP
jgi:hypothetical protein